MINYDYDIEDQNLPRKRSIHEPHPVRINSEWQPVHVHYLRPQDDKLHQSQWELLDIRKTISNWSRCLTIFAWLSVLFGFLYLIWSLIQATKIDKEEIEFLDSSGYLEVKAPSAPFVLERLIESQGGVIMIVMGIMCLRTSTNPSIKATWSLFRETIFLAILHYAILLIRYILISIAINFAFNGLQDNKSSWKGFNQNSTVESFSTGIYNEIVENSIRPNDSFLTIKNEFLESTRTLFFTSLAYCCCFITWYYVVSLKLFYNFNCYAERLETIQSSPKIKQARLCKSPPKPSSSGVFE